MIRAACLLGLIALAVLITISVRLDGATATLFSFLGIPALGAAMGLYVLQRWRAGALAGEDGRGRISLKPRWPYSGSETG